jgi:hypothetical protein
MSNAPSPDPRDLVERLNRALPPHSRALSDLDGADPLVDAARQLAHGPDVSLNSAALNRIETRLRQRQAEITRPQPRRTARSRRPIFQVVRYAAAACLVLILALGGVTRASASSLPGDNLYSAKRTIEEVRLALVTRNGEPSMRVDFADRRLDEFDQLLARREVYPRALREATDQMARALDLLAQGYGERTLDSRIADLSHRQSDLILSAVSVAPYNEWQALQKAAQDNAALQQRLAVEITLPGFVPDATATPLASPTLTALPSDTPMPSATPEPFTPISTDAPRPTLEPAAIVETPSPTPSLTPSISATPHKTKTPPGLGDDGDPTRTPPGHGATPGLGNNPPGHGGDNPGVGNNGQPPGQNKDKDKN